LSGVFAGAHGVLRTIRARTQGITELGLQTYNQDKNTSFISNDVSDK
jgi:hypothetical protein